MTGKVDLAVPLAVRLAGRAGGIEFAMAVPPGNPVEGVGVAGTVADDNALFVHGYGPAWIRMRLSFIQAWNESIQSAGPAKRPLMPKPWPPFS